MGEIIESRRRHYVGLDADKDSIPAGGKSKGDSYHANDKGKQYYWDGAAWKTGLGYEYVPRAVAAWDFTEGDGIIVDGAWKVDGLNCSVIVPAGAVAIEFWLFIKDAAASQAFTLRANATDKAFNNMKAVTQVANIELNKFAVIMCDADRLLDYSVAAGTDFARLSILGWYI